MLEVMFNCSVGFILVEVGNGDEIKFDFVPLTCYYLSCKTKSERLNKNLREGVAP